MNEKKLFKLKRILEDTHTEFLENNEIIHDALEPALKFQNPADKEFVAYICSILAYGRIIQVKRNIHALIDPMGHSPVEFLLNATSQDLKKLTHKWKHRFNTNHDMFVMLSVLQEIYNKHKTLECFINPAKHEDSYQLQLYFYKQLEDKLKKHKVKKSFYFLIPDPNRKSALKRMNLFLKWMVRDTEPDLGLWKSFSKSKLIVPLDTHVHKQALSLGFTTRTAADLQTALEITEKLKLMDVEDPTKFDFALCHLSINGKILTL